MNTYIKGNYKRSIYSSNGFVIGLFKIKETNDEEMSEYINKTITFTGNFDELNEDDTYIFYGELVEHVKYGIQFQVNQYERVKPSDKDGVIAFLSSDLFNGIGEKIATSIVEVLGENALEKILEEKTNLYLVPKLSKKKIDLIYDTLVKYEESHKTIVYLTELGFNMKDALNIYNFYKSNTIIQIEHNIFRIIDDVEDISFVKVDEISIKLNVDRKDENRIKSCIFYIMKSLIYKNGDTYLLFDEIYNSCINYLNIDIDILISNAAVGYSGSIINMDINKIRDNYEVNVFSNFNLIEVVLDNMLKKDKGKIIVMSSLAGIIPIPFLGSYSSTKASIIKLTECLRSELKILNSNIHISLIEPGMYKTGFNRYMFDNKYDKDFDNLFKEELELIRSSENILLKIFERKNYNSIIKQIKKAIKNDNKFLYRAPLFQSIGAKIYNIFN